MFREFNVKFEDVEMLGGADNLLKGTEITKVIVRGDNNKLSSLDSMLKNCNELDTVDGELDLNGVSDIDNLLEGTELVKSINLKNINNENISANNSFPHVDRINIGGELYNKKAMQNVIASKDWTFDNINYQSTVSDNIVEKEVNIVDDNKATIKDTLEQKAKGIEIIGQTYENLVVGSGEATLLDELTLESVDGNSKEFNPHLEQPVCVETIEGETYQNLVKGKGEYKLTDTFSTTWTESNNSIENPPSMIEIPEIFGNTVQGYANVVTEKMIYDSITNSSVATQVTLNSDNSLKISNWGDLVSWIPTDEDMEKHSIKLKPNTTYSMCAWRKETGERLGALARVESDGFKGNHNSSYKFTTDSTGRVFLCPYGYVYNYVVRVYEGDIPNIADLYEFDLNYIQSVGDLYVDESGEPILDEEGNEQYKLELISNDGNSNLNKTTILMPQPLRKIKGYSPKPYYKTDKLYWDNEKGNYFIEKNIDIGVVDLSNCTVSWSGYASSGYYDITFDRKDIYDNIKTKFTIGDTNICMIGTGFILTTPYWLVNQNNGNFKPSECISFKYSNNSLQYRTTNTNLTNEDLTEIFRSKSPIIVYGGLNAPQIIETKALEKPSLEAYSPKTYITTSAEIQPSQMTVTNKKVDFVTLGLQPNKDYTLQLDSIGKNDKPITVNLGGTEATVQPVNDTSKHHKVVVRTPSTLTTDKLDLSGEGVVVNDVMLFQGGSNDIKQEVEYVEGIQSIGELQEDGTYKIDILTMTPLANANDFVSGRLDKGVLGYTSDSIVQIKDGNIECTTLNVWRGCTSGFAKINPNTEYSFDYTIVSNGVEVIPCPHFYTKDKVYISDLYNKSTFTSPSNAEYVRIYFACGVIGSFTIKDFDFSNKSTQSILLPQPLNKIGEIKDKFYWDDNKGHYCIEQKFSQETSNFSNWVIKNQNDDFIEFTAKVSSTYKHLGKGVSNILRCYDEYTLSTSFNKEGISLRDNSIFIVLSKTRNILDTTQVQSFISNLFIIWELITPNIIDLPHLNKKYSLDTYIPTTYLECTNSPMQPSRILLESDTVRYKPSALETDTDYTVQFECKEKSDKKVKLNLGGAEKEVDVEVGLNHVNITTPSEIDTSLYKDRLFLSGAGNKVADVIVNKGEMNQYPGYFNGVQSVGELQDDGTYRIGIKTNEGFNISIQTNNPLAKGDKLYWNKSNKRYEIDRSGSVEVPAVEGDVIDLPRLYQRENTYFSTSTGNIKPSKIKLDYNDLD